MPGESVRVFISYSRKDRGLVAQLTKLLRSIGRSVFRDEDSIEGGKRWRQELADSIDAASHVMVFWCEHSAESEYVASEVDQAAKDADMRVIPVLLDSTPLSPVLSEYEWIDLRDAAGKAHGAAWRRSRVLLVASALLVVAGLAVGAWRWTYPPMPEMLEPIRLGEFLPGADFLEASNQPAVAFEAEPGASEIRLRSVGPESGADRAWLEERLAGSGLPMSCQPEAEGSTWLACRAETGHTFVARGLGPAGAQRQPIDLTPHLGGAMLGRSGTLYQARPADQGAGQVEIRALDSDRDALLGKLAVEPHMTCRPMAPDSQWLSCEPDRGYYIGVGSDVALLAPPSSFQAALAWLVLAAAATVAGWLVWRRRQRRLGELADSLSRSVAQAVEAPSG